MCLEQCITTIITVLLLLLLKWLIYFCRASYSLSSFYYLTFLPKAHHICAWFPIRLPSDYLSFSSTALFPCSPFLGFHVSWLFPCLFTLKAVVASCCCLQLGDLDVPYSAFYLLHEPCNQVPILSLSILISITLFQVRPWLTQWGQRRKMWQRMEDRQDMIDIDSQKWFQFLTSLI